jgi:hypothetical protein
MQLQIQQSMRNGKILMVSIQIMCENRHLTIGGELPVANATPSGSGTRGHGLSGLFFFSFSFFFRFRMRHTVAKDEIMAVHVRRTVQMASRVNGGRSSLPK